MHDDEQLINELAPNNTEAMGVYMPEEESEIKQDEEEERATIATGLPLMEELMDWFNEQIAACDSIKQLTNTVETTHLDFPAAVRAHDIVRTLLEAKQASLQSRYEAFINREDEQ